MPHHLIKAGATAVVLGCFGLLAPAHAASPLLLTKAAPLAIPVIDEGTAIEELERPNEVPPGSQEGATPKGNEAPPEEGENPAGDEVQELQRAFPSTEWPPSMKNKEE